MLVEDVKTRETFHACCDWFSLLLVSVMASLGHTFVTLITLLDGVRTWPLAVSYILLDVNDRPNDNTFCRWLRYFGV